MCRTRRAVVPQSSAVSYCLASILSRSACYILKGIWGSRNKSSWWSSTLEPQSIRLLKKLWSLWKKRFRRNIISSITHVKTHMYLLLALFRRPPEGWIVLMNKTYGKVVKNNLQTIWPTLINIKHKPLRFSLKSTNWWVIRQLTEHYGLYSPKFHLPRKVLFYFSPAASTMQASGGLFPV